ncbi:MAG: glycosyltransferase [Chloroflexi bacterium]|nr:glycosyltransferase [Chloroflexota bacterium]
MSDLSVVIVSYNTRELLRACLRSLRESVGLQLEVIVVDNASIDGSAEMVRQAFPEVVLLEQTSNTWYCGGNNIGIKRATADYVLLLNPDTEVAPDALALMHRFLLENPNYAGVTGQLRYPDGEIQRTGSEIPTYLSLLLDYTVLGHLLPTARRRVHDELYYSDWDRQSDREVKVIPGSCTLMRREDLWLDDDLLLYFPEDTLACQHQKSSFFLSAAKIKHHEKSSARNLFATIIFFRDLMIYCRKQHRTPKMLLLWLLSRPIVALMWLKNR